MGWDGVEESYICNQKVFSFDCMVCKAGRVQQLNINSLCKLILSNNICELCYII